MPGVSVARVAQRHGLNTNMVFRWIRELQQPGASSAPVQLLEVMPASNPMVPVATAASAVSTPPGMAMEVVFPAAVVRLQGDVSQANLRSVFLALSRLS